MRQFNYLLGLASLVIFGCTELYAQRNPSTPPSKQKSNLGQAQPAKTIRIRTDYLGNGVEQQILAPTRKIARSAPAAQTLEIDSIDPTGSGNETEAAVFGGANCDTFQVQVLGTQMTYGQGGPAVPVRLDKQVYQNAVPSTMQPMFGGQNLTVSATDTALLQAWQWIEFYAKFAYPNFTTPVIQNGFLSSDPNNALILVNGTNYNQVALAKGIQPAYGGQIPIPTILSGYLDGNGIVTNLTQYQMLILYELGSTDSASSAFDWNDLVLKVTADCPILQETSGFNWYLSTNNIANQFCSYNVLYPTGSHYRSYTSWTTPGGVGQIVPRTFRTVVGTVLIEAGSSPLQPPNYPGFTIMIHDDPYDIAGNFPDYLVNQNYVKKYVFNQGSPGASFVNLNPPPGGITMRFSSGAGTQIITPYEASFDLSNPSSEDPPGPFYLQPGARYWFSIYGNSSGFASQGYPCLPRLDYNLFPSPPPFPPVTVQMTTQQCDDWDQSNGPADDVPNPCYFQLGTNDFYRIADLSSIPPDGYFCSRPESFVNPFYPSPSILPTPGPNCMDSSNRPCCQRTYAGRWAMALETETILP
ncbi:MAG: hypothetical protein DCC75_00885 [Proteobacteria bacterium]|nr:MAG: hypothetical protein DCC75_00885 [Pseudomonadota bacterium]